MVWKTIQIKNKSKGALQFYFFSCLSTNNFI